jgi:hypothetical protein
MALPLGCLPLVKVAAMTCIAMHALLAPLASSAPHHAVSAPQPHISRSAQAGPTTNDQSQPTVSPVIAQAAVNTRELRGLQDALPYLMSGRSLGDRESILAGLWCQEARYIDPPGEQAAGATAFEYDYFGILQHFYDRMIHWPTGMQTDAFTDAVMRACPGRLFTSTPSG